MRISTVVLVRIISFAAAAAICAAGFIGVTYRDMTEFRRRVTNEYSLNLDELDGSLYNISIALKKAAYASTATQLNTLAVELCTESTVAQNSLSRLPSYGSELDNVNRFLSQVGDYTLYLSKKVVRGEDINDDERDNLHKLSQTAGSISSSVGIVRTEYEEEGMWLAEFSSGIGQSVGDTFSDSLTGLETLLADYPTLVYDGPFSDHMLNGTAKLLESTSVVPVEEARTTAAAALGIDASQIESETDSEGKIASFDFTSGTMSVSVTKSGGYICYMRKYREIGDLQISYDDAVKKAYELLEASQGSNFVSTYYFTDEGVCTINFAYKEGATVCYPDLIKVGVALDNGEIVLVEAAGYIANHHSRTVPTPKYSAAEAAEKLSRELSVNSVRRAIIPTDGNAERHCYEFSCTGTDGEELLVYVNVQTLEEESILVLLKTDGGTMTK